jgi:hypothetical protein
MPVAYLALAAALLGLPSMASAQIFPPVFSLKTTVTITGNPLNSFDISWVDPEVHAYFLSDRSNAAVDVIDTFTKAQSKLLPGEFAGNVPSCPVANGCNGPNGVLSFNNKGRVQVWAGDGPRTACPYYGTTATFIPGTSIPTEANNTNCSTVKVIDFATGSLIANIPTGGGFRADEMCYDPADHLIEVANDSEEPWPWINYISTDTYEVVARIIVVGATNGLEQCKWNPRNGLIYANVPEINGNGNDITDGNTYVIDPRFMPPRVVEKFDIPVSECAGPQGMAIGPAPEIMLGCNAMGPPDTGTGSSEIGTGPQNAAVLDEYTGELIKVLPNQGGNDEVWFNPGDGLYFLAQGSHATEQYLGIVRSLPIDVTQDILIGTGPGKAHSVAADPIQNEVYFPVPNNEDSSTICPTANGSVAVFASQQAR